MVVTKIYDQGFEPDEDYFGYDEVRKLYWLTKYGYEKGAKQTCLTSE